MCWDDKFKARKLTYNVIPFNGAGTTTVPANRGRVGFIFAGSATASAAASLISLDSQRAMIGSIQTSNPTLVGKIEEMGPIITDSLLITASGFGTTGTFTEIILLENQS